MRVKRFVAPTVQEAMNKMKQEMGKDAVILHTRKIKEGGILGFFAREMVEITGAVEDSAVIAREAASRESVGPARANEPQGLLRPGELPGKGEPLRRLPLANPAGASRSGGTLRPDDVIAGAGLATGGEIVKKSESEGKSSQGVIDTELKQIKMLMGEILGRLHEGEATLPVELYMAFKRLRENEVDEALARQIIRQIFEGNDGQNGWNPERVRRLVLAQLASILGQPRPIFLPDSGKSQEVVMMVGPTGVGKTTTIAKLAATFSIVNRRKVGLITADTYRIAAVEQLKTFGDIIGVPVDVVFTPQALRSAIERHRDKELLLVDTAGRSHKNDSQLEELAAYVEQSQPSHSILVLSATTKFKDLLQITEGFSRMNIDRYLFTKLDETNHYGSILNLIHRTGKSLSYITTGQNVPDDMEVADPNKLSNLIYGETNQ
ncbi:GTP-binding signal recognition particle protein, putative [Heliomicrobium modesticaldum Ice1]|uniref:Flagellar biosynthesis protein FlhF n=1 Tax=Heliobacterium modesticaldum (strain ATCC 51547 / Ice1) TaxID=498761 RepID=B0THC5_HELMI|nr:flagellar biosynthesis protein FlhF [Heliomicrobium modesticaldum]ABZ84800.1 GTP-binding signal recognition particle protein, putative [Heliomicrobium modesticaldum Ice1]